MTQKLSPIERLPIAVARFIRQTYTPPGRAYRVGYYGFEPHHWKLLHTPLINEISRIPQHECRIGWMNSYDCCWGQTHIVKLTYAVEGYGADIGAHFDYKTDQWSFTVWAD